MVGFVKHVFLFYSSSNDSFGILDQINKLSFRAKEELRCDQIRLLVSLCQIDHVLSESIVVQCILMA